MDDTQRDETQGQRGTEGRGSDGARVLVIDDEPEIRRAVQLGLASGEFTVAVLVRPLHTVLPGKYMLRGELKYQACDNAACYPPKRLPVEFEVKVAKAVSPPKKNPAQSPHAHR